MIPCSEGWKRWFDAGMPGLLVGKPLPAATMDVESVLMAGERGKKKRGKKKRGKKKRGKKEQEDSGVDMRGVYGNSGGGGGRKGATKQVSRPPAPFPLRMHVKATYLVIDEGGHHPTPISLHTYASRRKPGSQLNLCTMTRQRSGHQYTGARDPPVVTRREDDLDRTLPPKL